MSLRARLALLTVGAFAVGLVVIGLLVPSLVESFLTDRLDEEIERASRFAAAAVTSDFPRPPAGQAGPPGTTSLLNEVYAELRNVDGTLVTGEFLEPGLGTRSVPELPTVLDVDRRGPRTVDGVGDVAPRRWRVEIFDLFDRVGARSALLVVAVPMTSVDDTVSQVNRIVLRTSAITLLGVGVLAWVLIRVGLRPLKQMERAAAAITDAGDLGRRVEHPSLRTEIGRLGSTMNEMLERLETSFTAQRKTESRLRQFASDASHELRTPLTSISGYAQLYRRGGDDPQQVERSMTRIEQEAVRMKHLVEDLLLLARSDEGLPLADDEVDLVRMVSDLVADARVLEPDRPIGLRAEPITMRGDQQRISQAVLNLLTNARVHTPPRTPVEVHVGCESDDGGAFVAVVAVVDHGLGLGVEDRDRVFERFYRADRSRSRVDGAGAGLGLSITEAIVRAHGGSVTATATPGGGSTFTLRFPRAARVVSSTKPAKDQNANLTSGV